MNAITEVAQLLTRYNPRFATANYATVKRWIEEGADLHQDILPTIKAWIARKSDIYSLGFFTPYIRQARKERLASATRPITAQQRARRIAYQVRVMGKRLPTDERWLARFEEIHGTVGAPVQQSQGFEEPMQIVVERSREMNYADSEPQERLTILNR